MLGITADEVREVKDMAAKTGAYVSKGFSSFLSTVSQVCHASLTDFCFCCWIVPGDGDGGVTSVTESRVGDGDGVVLVTAMVTF